MRRGIFKIKILPRIPSTQLVFGNDQGLGNENIVKLGKNTGIEIKISTFGHSPSCALQE